MCWNCWQKHIFGLKSTVVVSERENITWWLWFVWFMMMNWHEIGKWERERESEREREWRGRIYAMQVVVTIQLIAIFCGFLALCNVSHHVGLPYPTRQSHSKFPPLDSLQTHAWFYCTLCTLFFFSLPHNSLHPRLPPKSYTPRPPKTKIKLNFIFTTFLL